MHAWFKRMSWPLGVYLLLCPSSGKSAGWYRNERSGKGVSELKVAQSCPTLCFSRGLYSPWNSPGQNTGGGSHSLLQGIFPTQGSSPGLPHCRWLLNQLSHQGSPRILEWAAYPFSRGSSWPRTRTGVSCMVGGFFIS